MPVPRLRAVTTVFLDRDGTVNVKPSEGRYVISPADLVLLPGVAHAIGELNAAGVRTVLVTNQRWLSNPTADAMLYTAIHARLEELLAIEGAWLDAAYHCPHTIDICDCRKPGPGMLRRAAAEHNFDLAKSVIIGDKDSDVLAGRSAGAQTIRLRRSTNEIVKASPDVMVKDLPAAVRLILAAVHASSLSTSGQAGTAPPY